jgi:hypothetical protein
MDFYAIIGVPCQVQAPDRVFQPIAIKKGKGSGEMHPAKTVLLGLFLAVLLVMVAPTSQGQTPQSAGSEANVNGSSQSDLRSEVEQLELLVREQQKRIAALEAERQPATASVRPSDAPLVKNLEASSTPPPSGSAPQNPAAIQGAQAGSSSRGLGRSRSAATSACAANPSSEALPMSPSIAPVPA